MPLSDGVIKGLKQDLAIARKRALNFGLCLGKMPDATILMIHRTKKPDALGKLAKRESETNRVAFGTLSVESKNIMLSCVDDPPSGTARKVKLFLKEAGLKMKVVILDEAGIVLEEDGDEDDNDSEVDAGAQETDAERDPAEAIWLKYKAALQPALLKVLKEGLGDPSKLRAAWAMATERAEGGDFAGASKIAKRMVEMIKGLAKSGSNGAQNAEAGGQIADNLVPFVKARLNWIDARRSLQGELEKLKSVIVSAAADDEDDHMAVLASVDEIFEPLSQLDESLQEKLEELVETPEGEARTQKKKEVIGIVKTYSGALETPFFKEIDNNPFAKVDVRSTAQASLGEVVRALRG